MKYLVNRETKEHRILNEEVGGVTLVHTSVKLWDIVEADPEGWIKHDGTYECPLPDGCGCEFMHSDKHVLHTTRAEGLGWSVIRYYRPILNDNQRPDFGYGDSFVDDKPEANPVPCATPEESLIDRLTSAHKAASELPDIIAELREVLEPMGYDLVARDPFFGAEDDDHGWCGDDPRGEPEPDMTDWRNWKEGDLVECVMVPDEHQGYYVAGERYFVHSVDPDDKGRPVCIFSKPALDLWCEDGCFRFHSRPTKEQDK